MSKRSIASLLVLSMLSSGVLLRKDVQVFSTEKDRVEVDELQYAVDEEEVLSPTESGSEGTEELQLESGEVLTHTMDSSRILEVHIGEQWTMEQLLDFLEATEILNLNYEDALIDEVMKEEQHGLHEVTVQYINTDDEVQEEVIILSVSGKPEISVHHPRLSEGDVITLEALGVVATDFEDGDLTKEVQILEVPFEPNEAIDLSMGNPFKMTLSVEDKDGHVTIETVEIFVTRQEVIPYSSELHTLSKSSNMTISGSNRYKTAIEISQMMYRKADIAILVSGVNFPDALAAGPLATKLQAPILLTPQEKIIGETLVELERLAVKKVVIMGGPLAISESVEASLRENGFDIERIQGSNRYATSLETASKMDKSDTVVIVNGEQFPDAMIAGSFAAQSGYPIILIKENEIPNAVRDYVESEFDHVILMGGTLVIPTTIFSEFRNMGKTVTRVSGTSRYMTSVETAKRYFGNAETAVVANGLDFMDALAAVPYAAKMNVPILLAGHDEVHEGILEYLMNSSLKSFHYIGGPLAISSNVKNRIQNPSLVPIEYRVRTTDGTWTGFIDNGKTAGSTSHGRLSQVDFSLNTKKDLSIRYSVSVDGLGWQSFRTSGASGIAGRFVNGLMMELEGKDAASYNLSYRVYVEGNGWTSWVSGGNVAGGNNRSPILAVEAKVLKGNALANLGKPFPNQPVEATFSFTTAMLNFRTGPSMSAGIILRTARNANLEIIRKHTMGSNDVWAEANYRVNGEVIRGYAHMSNVREEKHVSKALVTIEGLENGGEVPATTKLVTGDVYHASGVKDVRYYINGNAMGSVPFGLLTTSSLAHGFSVPQETGYRISIPANVWRKGAINSLKVEIIANDGSVEWEAVYLNDSKHELLFEQYVGSYNYYLNTELTKNNPSFYVGSTRRNATKSELDINFDPTQWIASDLYKYIYVDLGFNPNDYQVSAEQINRELSRYNTEGNILVDMGAHFLRGAMDFRINPYYLASHALLETGWGRSTLANGQTLTEAYNFQKRVVEPVPIEKQEILWYNVYGIGAYSGVENFYGASMAYHQGWDSVEEAIYGGARWIAEGYINRAPEPQNTNFKMRYNLHENMTHQYAEDVRWGHKQAGRIKNLFESLDEEVPLRFIVPLFGQVRSS